MKGKMKILIAEDDENINNLLSDILKQNEYEVIQAFSGSEAIINIRHEEVSLILLDLMLPGKSGQEVLDYIMKESHIPVIVISAREEIDIKVKVLKMGADDYITKPFNIEEVLVRIEVALRRNKIDRKDNNQIVNFKDINIDIYNREIKVNDQLIELTKIEYKILSILMQNPKKVFTKANIFESAWEDDFLGDHNTITVHISNLRNKLSKYGKNKEYIQTVWGIGYKLAE